MYKKVFFYSLFWLINSTIQAQTNIDFIKYKNKYFNNDENEEINKKCLMNIQNVEYISNSIYLLGKISCSEASFRSVVIKMTENCTAATEILEPFVSYIPLFIKNNINIIAIILSMSLEGTSTDWLYVSKNNGKTWQKKQKLPKGKNEHLANTNDFKITEEKNNVLFYTNIGFLNKHGEFDFYNYKSNNYGITWKIINKEIIYQHKNDSQNKTVTLNNETWEIKTKLGKICKLNQKIKFEQISRL